jgi:hypothetical protein
MHGMFFFKPCELLGAGTIFAAPFCRVRPNECGAPLMPGKLNHPGLYSDLKISKRGVDKMKFILCRLEFVVKGLKDIRLLYRTWDSLWTVEDRVNTDCIMVFVTVDDWLPGEEVILNFNATEEVLDKFLSILAQNGLKFSCNDFVPGLIKNCRIDCDRGVIADGSDNNGHDPGGRQDC